LGEGLVAVDKLPAVRLTASTTPLIPPKIMKGLACAMPEVMHKAHSTAHAVFEGALKRGAARLRRWVWNVRMVSPIEQDFSVCKGATKWVAMNHGGSLKINPLAVLAHLLLDGVASLPRQYINTLSAEGNWHFGASNNDGAQ